MDHRHTQTVVSRLSHASLAAQFSEQMTIAVIPDARDRYGLSRSARNLALANIAAKSSWRKSPNFQ